MISQARKDELHEHIEREAHRLFEDEKDLGSLNPVSLSWAVHWALCSLRDWVAVSNSTELMAYIQERILDQYYLLTYRRAYAIRQYTPPGRSEYLMA